MAGFDVNETRNINESRNGDVLNKRIMAKDLISKMN